MTSRVNSAIFGLVMVSWGEFRNKNEVTSNRVSQCTEQSGYFVNGKTAVTITLILKIKHNTLLLCHGRLRNVAGT